MRYGRRPDVTWVLPWYSAEQYRPRGPNARVGWLEGRAPAWLLGPRVYREERASAHATKVAEMLARQPAAGGRSPGSQKVNEPQWVEARAVFDTRMSSGCTIIDVRAQSRRHDVHSIPGSIALPFPNDVKGFPCLPDDEAIMMAERLLGGAGPRVILGDCGTEDGTRATVQAAHLVAMTLSLRPSDLLMIRGGIERWAEVGGLIETWA